MFSYTFFIKYASLSIQLNCSPSPYGKTWGMSVQFYCRISYGADNVKIHNSECKCRNRSIFEEYVVHAHRKNLNENDKTTKVLPIKYNYAVLFMNQMYCCLCKIRNIFSTIQTSMYRSAQYVELIMRTTEILQWDRGLHIILTTEILQWTCLLKDIIHNAQFKEGWKPKWDILNLKRVHSD